jgi:outer membrane biosynthesis protein TonB
MLALVLALAISQEAAAAPPPKEWNLETLTLSRRPAPVFPDQAMSWRVWEGEAQLRCQIVEDRFSNCTVEAESTPGVGFGAAAVRAMRQARFEAKAGGPRTGDVYLATIRFALPPAMRR